MNPTTIGPAEKGSQYQLQQWVMQKRSCLKEMLLSASESLKKFGGEWEWLSPIETPIEKESFCEYRDDFLDVLGFKQHENELRDFWPRNGPQWDGLIKLNRAKKKPGVVLIEAKSHIPELKSDCLAKDSESISKIKRAIRKTQQYLRMKRDHDWRTGFYQTANRLAHLYFMNERLGIPTWLALVYFVGDETIETPTSKEQWEGAITAVDITLGIPKRNRLAKSIIHVFPQALQ